MVVGMDASMKTIKKICKNVKRPAGDRRVGYMLKAVLHPLNHSIPLGAHGKKLAQRVAPKLGYL